MVDLRHRYPPKDLKLRDDPACRNTARVWYMKIGFLVLVLLVVVPLLNLITALRSSMEPPSPEVRALMTATELSLVLRKYAADSGGYPSTDAGLGALVRDPGAPGWNGPYVTLLPVDPWGRAYGYKNEDRRVSVISAGSDGDLGTSDDVTHSIVLGNGE